MRVRRQNARTAGHADPHLVSAWHTSACAARHRLQMELHLRCSLPRARNSHWLGPALCRNRGDEPAPRRNSQNRRAGGPRAADHRRCRLACGKIAESAGQYYPALLKLAPYAPELNPMENVWQYLRANKLAITVFDSYEDILDKCADAWNFFATEPERITSITQREWIKVN
jgi:transposase